jgi:hypothetical protein
MRGKTLRVGRLKPVPPPGVILSYTAKVVSNNTADELREFIVNFSADTGAFAVAEKEIPNSGFRGGRFLNTTVCENPETGKKYRPCDVTLGKEIVVNGWVFRLVQASEGTLKAIDEHPDMFPSSSIVGIKNTIKKGLKNRLSEFAAKLEGLDKNKHGKIEFERFVQILGDYGVSLDASGSVSLLRSYRFADTDLFLYRTFLAELK